jgi:hypothetical protein
MSDNLNLGDSPCCQPGIPGFRKLTFPDGSQEGIIGLDSAMDALFHQGVSADSTSGSEILERLKGRNYFAPSARKIYEELFSKEYQKFLQHKTKSTEKETNTMANKETNQETKKKGIFNMFKSNKDSSENSCCNMKIVPKDQAAKESSKGGCCNFKIVPKEQTSDKSSQK